MSMDDNPVADKDGLLKAEHIVYDTAPMRVPQGSVASRAASARPEQLGGEPDVDYIRDENGAVKSILIRCACGREITLQCEYLEGGAP